MIKYFCLRENTSESDNAADKMTKHKRKRDGKYVR